MSLLPPAGIQLNEAGKGDEVPFQQYFNLPLGRLPPIAACVKAKTMYTALEQIPFRIIPPKLPNAKHRHFFAKKHVKSSGTTAQSMDMDEEDGTDEGDEEDEEADEDCEGGGEGGWLDDAFASASANPKRSSGSILSCRVLVDGVQCKYEKSTTLGSTIRVRHISNKHTKLYNSLLAFRNAQRAIQGKLASFSLLPSPF